MALPSTRSVTRCRRVGSAAWINLSEHRLGFTDFELSSLEDTFEVLGGGAVGAQGTGFVDTSFTLNTLDNATTRSQFVTGNGKLFEFERNREGMGAGKPKETFRAFLRINHVFEARGARRFELTGEVNGSITRGVN
ncbi:MAG: hypothetical protein OXE50_02190 [Chloroflexi bacterium]|nr:hypothetical protein [Chloroflexota bacterium]